MFVKTLSGRDCCSHFTDEKTKTHRGALSRPAHTVSRQGPEKLECARACPAVQKLRTRFWIVRSPHPHQAAKHRPLLKGISLPQQLSPSFQAWQHSFQEQEERREEGGRERLGSGSRSGREGQVSGNTGGKDPVNQSAPGLSLCLAANPSTHLSPTLGGGS